MSDPFFTAVKSGDQKKLSLILANEPGVLRSKDENGLSAVLLAIYYGHPELVRPLIAAGAELDIFDASAAGELSMVEDWASRQPELVNGYGVDGFQPLGLACFFGHAEVAAFLVNAGARVNSPARNSQKVMPLHSAVASRQLEIAELLLDNRAEVNARQAHDYTPLHAAAQNGQTAMVDLLLRFGADVHARSADGKTPYHMATEAGHVALAERLRKNR